MSGIFGSGILEVAIGLVVVYLLLSLAVSVVNELVAQVLGLRARTLEEGLRNLLDGSPALATERSLAVRLLKHPVICGFGSATGTARPSYIPARQFATVLLDLVAPDASVNSPDYWQQVREGVSRIENTHVRTALTTLINQSQRDAIALRASIEQWYDDAMDRVSGWYKRKVRTIVLVLGLAFAVLLNADSLGLAQTLWTEPALRSGLVAGAGQLSGLGPDGRPVDLTSRVDQLSQVLQTAQEARLPIGWRRWPEGVEWAREVLGILLTTLAVSLGAPFWFDILNRFMLFRATGRPPVSSRRSIESAQAGHMAGARQVSGPWPDDLLEPAPTH